MLSRCLFVTGIIGALAGCQTELAAPEVSAPELLEVTPASGFHGDAVAIEIEGRHLLPRLTQDLSQPDGIAVDAEFQAWFGDTELDDVTYVDDEHLTATVPAGIAADTYELRVETPHGLTATLADAYTALQYRDPVVSSVAPGDVVNDAASDVVVAGENFVQGLSAELIPASGAAIPMQVADVVSGSFSATVPAGTSAGSYGVRVQRADGTEASLDAALTVWEPAALSAVATLSDAVVSIGQSFSVSVDVSNAGGSASSGVSVAAPTQGGTGSATLDSGPTPASADIAAGQNQVFVFTYTASSAGAVTFSADASGSNAHSGRANLAPTAMTSSLTIQSGAALGVTVSAAPTPVSVSQTITVTVSVSNSGEAAANTVVPGLTPSVPTAVALATGPVPADASIAGGASTDFIFTYDAVAAASITFSASASGFDANSGAVVTAAAADSNAVEVQAPPGFSLVWSNLPTDISPGVPFSPILTVTNTGGVTANDVAPTGFVVGGSTGTSCTGPTPATAAIPPSGASQDYTYDCTAGATPGTFDLSAGAEGTDANSAQTITAAPVTSAQANVLEPPDVTLAWTVPGTVSASQAFTATLTATNVGAVGVNAAVPTNFAISGATGTSCGAPAPASADIGASTSQDFVYSCTGGGVGGQFDLSAGLAGTDASTSAPVTVAPETSTAITLQGPATFSILTVAVTPTVVQQGETGLAVTYDVSNGGDTAANVSAATVTFRRGGSNVGGDYTVTPDAGNPTTIGVGATETFNFDVAVDATARVGLITLNGQIDGTDASSGLPISDSTAQTTDSWTVQGAPTGCIAIDTTVADVNVSFNFDASCSTDPQEAVDALTVDWDWESDGTFDVTGAGATETTAHAYTTTGIFHITARVVDSGGGVDYADGLVVVAPAASTVTVTSGGAQGAGTLDEVISSASNGDTIRFDPGVTSISLPGGGLAPIAAGDLTFVGHNNLTITIGNKTVDITSAGNTFVGLNFSSSNRQCLVLDANATDSWFVGNGFDGCSTSLTIAAGPQEIGPGNFFENNGVAIDANDVDELFIHGNVFASCNSSCVELTASSPLTVGHRFEQNLFYLGNGDAVLATDSNMRSLLFYNNTFDGFNGLAINLGGTGHEAKNNIFSNNNNGAICDNDGDLDATSFDFNNLYQNGDPGGCAPGASGSDNLAVDPLYANLGNQDYSLLSSSQCVDAGTDLNIDLNGARPGDFEGSAPDLGAVESF